MGFRVSKNESLNMFNSQLRSIFAVLHNPTHVIQISTFIVTFD